MSSKKRHEQKHHFVVDEDLGSSYWAELKQDDRFEVDRFEEFWSPGTKDHVWIPQVGKEGLIVITHDGRIRRQHRDIVVQYRARIIVSVGRTDFKGQAQAFRASWSKIDRFLTRNKAPYIARFRRPSGKQLKKLKPVGDIVLDSVFKTTPPLTVPKNKNSD